MAIFWQTNPVGSLTDQHNLVAHEIGSQIGCDHSNRAVAVIRKHDLAALQFTKSPLEDFVCHLFAPVTMPQPRNCQLAYAWENLKTCMLTEFDSYFAGWRRHTSVASYAEATA